MLTLISKAITEGLMRPVAFDTRPAAGANPGAARLPRLSGFLAGHGYGGASIERDNGGGRLLRRAAIYSNFESKEAVFLELLRVYMERDMAELEADRQSPPHQLSAALC